MASKLTFILPVILVAIGYVRRFPLMGFTVASPEDFMAFTKRLLNIPVKTNLFIPLPSVAFIFVGAAPHSRRTGTRRGSGYAATETSCMPGRGRRNSSSVTPPSI